MQREERMQPCWQASQQVNTARDRQRDGSCSYTNHSVCVFISYDRNASSQHVKWGLQRLRFYCLPGSRDKRSRLENLSASVRKIEEIRLDVRYSEERLKSLLMVIKKTCLCVCKGVTDCSAQVYG